ncbi:hypothetical protein ACJX0J_027382, partial [Zea mays]
MLIHMEALQKVYMLGKQEQIGILCFSKVQIQEKEKELKRDYKMCMIQADPPIWDNIIKVSLLPCFCKLEIFIVCCHFSLYCASPNHYISWPAGQTYSILIYGTSKWIRIASFMLVESV